MPALERTAFRAMGTGVTLLGPSRDRAFEDAARIVRSIFEREERRFSRFRADSELCAVNASAGSWRPVSREFARLTRFALDAWTRTEGRFDPTVLGAVVAAGYDRDFDELIAGARAALRPATPCGRAGEIEVEDDRVRLPAGVGLDLGGVAKGWTGDLAARAAVGSGLPWALVNAGGDLRITGDAPAGGIDVGIEDPERLDTEAARVVLSGGALATSSVTRRAWGLGLHHLIDPATGRPAVGPVLQATVWAPECAEAEIRAKDVLLAGESSLEREAALLVLRDGRILTNLTGGAEAAA
jgi:thiamine biosynthesis lipoprotein